MLICLSNEHVDILRFKKYKRQISGIVLVKEERLVIDVSEPWLEVKIE